MYLIFFGDNFYKNKENFKIFSLQILEEFIEFFWWKPF